jgi:hypothetical protein
MAASMGSDSRLNQPKSRDDSEGVGSVMVSEWRRHTRP